MQNIGSVMLDIASYELCEEDRQLLLSDCCGGVILFSRNFISAEQILTLTNSIREINPSIIIAVDQEGGRVQRFTDGFSKLPSLGVLGEIFEENPEKALEMSSCLGELMALEVQSVGCDISFAPILDLGHLNSRVIGKRAFSTNINAIIQLGRAYISGMSIAGMSATGKHFPGHGSVEADSHVDIPYDKRDFSTIAENDLKPFKTLKDDLGAIMPAHIIYSKVDPSPAGFSAYWLKQVLREEINFNGVIFSDDLSMKGAEVVGDFSSRAKNALDAGCDMVLVCNDRHATHQVIQSLQGYRVDPASQLRLKKLKSQTIPVGLNNLKKTSRWQTLTSTLESIINQ